MGYGNSVTKVALQRALERRARPSAQARFDPKRSPLVALLSLALASVAAGAQARFTSSTFVYADPPRWTMATVTLPAAAAGTSYSAGLAGFASDPDAVLGDSLTFSKTSGDSWIKISAAGAVTGTAPRRAGTAQATARARDKAGRYSSATIRIPVVMGPAAGAQVRFTSATQGQAFAASIAGAASDADPGDELTFSKVFGPSWVWLPGPGDEFIYTKVPGPAWLSAVANGTISGNPGPGDAGTTNSWVVRATDQLGACGEAVLLVYVANVNDPPRWTMATVTLPAAAAGAAYSASLAGFASDPDAVLGDKLTFSKTSGDSWIKISAAGEVSGTAPRRTGTAQATARARDKAGRYSSATIRIPVQ